MKGRASSLSICFYCADQNPHRDRSFGITGYTRGLLSELRSRGDFDLSAITSRSSFKLPAGIREVQLPFRTDAAVGRIASDHLHPLLASSSAAIWHYPKGFLPLFFKPRARVVATIHDTILQHYADKYPQTRSSAEFAYWLAILKRSVSRADAILTISEFSKAEIVRFADRHRLRLPPVEVTYLGIEFPAAVKSPWEKADYVLHLASSHPHKRTHWLCETWQELQRQGEELPPLRLVGRLPAESTQLVSSLEHVSYDPVVPRDELGLIMARARALLLPSEIEGFGIPAGEAYFAGTPVAYVANTAVAEILGADAKGKFEFQVDSFACALREVLSMTRENIEQKANELRGRFNWRVAADKTVQVYRSLG